MNSKEVRFVFPESVPWVAFPYRHLFVFDFFFNVYSTALDGRGDPEELVYFIPRATLLIFSLSLPFRARILGFVSTVDTEKREGGFIFIYVSV